MMKVLKNQFVTTRDGIQLATDIYLPYGEGPWPVVMERTPYNKEAPSRSELTLSGHQISREEMAQAFVDAGFVCVFQDCRGRYRSTGAFTKYVNEAEDGYDTCRWLVEQAWSNGKIGTMGLSYAAHVQMAMACLNPPGLAVMALDSGGFSSAYECGIRTGGAFELKQATWAYRQALVSPAAKADPAVKAALEAEDIREWFKSMPWKEGQSPLRHVPEYERYLLEQWRQGEFSDYWKKSGIYTLESYQDIPDIPILLMSSWYDVYVKSTLDNFRVLNEKNASETILIMGPWLHGDRNVTYCGDVEFGDKASFDRNVDTDWLTYRLRWFKKHLFDDQTQHFDTVMIFQMGGGSGKKDQHGRLLHGGEWVKSERWPLASVESKKFYLSNHGLLSDIKPVINSQLSFIADPNNPVPTIGGALTSGQPVFDGGAYDQKEDIKFFGSSGNGMPLSERDDVLVFQTEPLQEDLVVMGNIQARLYLETNVMDTDLTIKVVDVYPASQDYPQGFAMNISDGILRCRYHHGYDQPELLDEGIVYEINVNAFSTSNIFKKGHRIRLDIAGSNFPKFDVNPNTGGPEGFPGEKIIAKNTIHFSPEYASYLEVDIML